VQKARDDLIYNYVSPSGRVVPPTSKESGEETVEGDVPSRVAEEEKKYGLTMNSYTRRIKRIKIEKVKRPPKLHK